jgi:hypothetical protein
VVALIPDALQIIEVHASMPSSKGPSAFVEASA